MNRNRTTPICVALVVLACLVALGAASLAGVYRRAKQVRTFANMQGISASVAAAMRDGKMDPAGLLAIVESVSGGRDSWGNKLVLEVRLLQGERQFVLVSPGSDGLLDYSDIGAYFLLPERDTKGKFEEDIVFRNGRPVTLAGK